MAQKSETTKRERMGKSQKLYKCCREIRLQGGSMKVGEIYSGYNTLTDLQERWKCLKVAKDFNDNILQQLLTP